MNIISKKTLPSGGFSYVQPGFESIPFPGMNGWTQQVSSIVTFRKGNNLPRATAVEVAEDLEAYTCARLPRICRDHDGGSKKNDTSQPRKGPVARAVSGLVDKAKRGFNTISSWLGEGGKPVPQELSELRGSICAQCPYNKPESGFSVMGSVAATVKDWSEARAGLKLSTSHDDKLGICEICGCHLKLKVHVPAQHIEAGTPDGLLQLFPANFCWIRKEAEASQTKS